MTILSTQLISYNYTQRSLIDVTNTQKGYTMERLAYQIDTYMTTMEQIAHTVIDSDEIQQYFTRSGQNDSVDGDAVSQYLASFLRAREDITTIALFGFDGTRITSSSDQQVSPFSHVEQQQWYQNAVHNPGRTIISSAHVQNLFFGIYPWVVSMSMTFHDQITDEPLGVLLVDLNFNRIRELSQPVMQDPPEYIFILDSHGDYVFHPQQQLVYSGITTEPTESLMEMTDRSDPLEVSGKSYITRQAQSADWRIVCVTELYGSMGQWRYIQAAYATIGLIAFIVVGLVANLLSRSITHPIKELCAVMKSVDRHNFNITAEIDSTVEIQQLADEFNIMVRKIRGLIDQIHHEQELKRKSELKALQAQINPHFLYNTLDSIIWMSEMDRNREVVLMTSALARLFRISISKGREIITVREELLHVESYLTIQKMRYRDHFSYSIEVDESLHAYPCLKIILQPLVENAIYHGLKTVEYKGLIKISGFIQDDRIILQVIDNGVGMDPLLLERLISDSSARKQLRSSSGVGLHNVHERLRLYFGEPYGLTCSCTPGERTVISVIMPATPPMEEDL